MGVFGAAGRGGGSVPAGSAASTGANGTDAPLFPPGEFAWGGLVSAPRLRAIQATAGSVSVMGRGAVEESSSGEGDVKVSFAPVRVPASKKAAA